MIKRINITIDDDLLNRFDLFLEKRYVTRSGFISMILSTYLDYVDNVPSSSDFDIKHTTGSEEV